MGVTINMGRTQLMIQEYAERLRPVGINGYVGWLAGPAHHYLQHRAEQRFKDNEMGGGEWPPLTEATGNWRASRGYGRHTPINRRTNAMYNYLTKGGPQIRTDGGNLFLLWPGEAAGRMRQKLEQAQGIKEDATPRPVIDFTPDDIAILFASFTRFVEQGRGKK